MKLPKLNNFLVAKDVQEMLQTARKFKDMSLHKIQLKISHEARNTKNDKRVKLWHKDDILVALNVFKDKDLITTEEYTDLVSYVKTSQHFKKTSILMSDMLKTLGLVHNAYLTAQEEYEEIGFGPLRTTSGIKYFNMTEELAELFEEYDIIYVDAKDKDNEIYDLQIQIKLKYLSFGYYD